MISNAKAAKAAKICSVLAFAGCAAFACPVLADAQYSVRRSPETIELEDTAHHTVVAVASSAGNLTRTMTVNGRNLLGPLGIPFLAPWANRLDEQGFYANGKHYALNMDLGNVRGAHPIHGFLSAAVWTVVESRADSQSAWVTSRLEFFRRPEWMAQFPFAHTIEMVHRLHDGALEISVAVNNLSAEPMPVSIGFHPYFQLTAVPRDEWTIGLAARTEWQLSPDKIPTGQTVPIASRFADAANAPLREHDLDHVFADLIRDASGNATMTVRGGSQRIDVVFGPNYHAAVVYAPKGRDFICFEPMAAITDALNLSYRGLYADLQSIPPGGTWKESFWVRPSGF
jgi:aldose 1-epimerase